MIAWEWTVTAFVLGFALGLVVCNELLARPAERARRKLFDELVEPRARRRSRVE